ncbi:hypothetical protein VL14_06230 [Cytobacillus firmus]|nr:hypothetical protein VL14_06230 [Cytobacillus firmus]
MIFWKGEPRGSSFFYAIKDSEYFSRHQKNKITINQIGEYAIVNICKRVKQQMFFHQESS